MSKFQELCHSYAASQRNINEYQAACRTFINEFIQRFTAYAEIPQGFIRIVPLHEPAKEGVNYTVSGAMNLAEDGYNHIGMILTVAPGPNQYPHQSLRFDLQFKRSNGNFIVKITKDHDADNIDPAKEDDFTHVFDRIIDLVNDYFNNGFQRLLDNAPEIQSIGFKVM